MNFFNKVVEKKVNLKLEEHDRRKKMITSRSAHDLDQFKKKSLASDTIGYKRVIKAENTKLITNRLYHDPISGFHLKCKYLKDSAISQFLHLGSLIMIDSETNGDIMYIIYYFEKNLEFHLLQFKVSSGVIKDLGILTDKQVLIALKKNKF